jgi:hypothetical protein
VARIERVLDGLLDVACLPAGLELYRRLCRHLWFIDQCRAAFYVRSYQELWGDLEVVELPPLK